MKNIPGQAFSDLRRHVRFAFTVSASLNRGRSCAPYIVNLPVPRNRGSLPGRGIPPDRMLATFAQDATPLLVQVSLQIGALHGVTARVSRIQPGGSSARASSRLACRTAASASRRFSRASSMDAPCVFTPGTSSTQAAHQSPHFWNTAVNMNSQYRPWPNKSKALSPIAAVAWRVTVPTAAF